TVRCPGAAGRPGRQASGRPAARSGRRGGRAARRGWRRCRRPAPRARTVSGGSAAASCRRYRAGRRRAPPARRRAGARRTAGSTGRVPPSPAAPARPARRRRGTRAPPAGRCPGRGTRSRSRPPARSVGVLEPDREGGLQIVLGVCAERDVRLGAEHPAGLRDTARDHLGHLVELGYPHDGDQVEVARHGVDLADPGQVGEGLRHLRNGVGGAVDEHDRGYHPVTVPDRPYLIASTRYSSGPTYPSGHTTQRFTVPSTRARAPITAGPAVPLTTASGATSSP